MIFVPEPIFRQRREIVHQLEAGELTEAAAAERLIEIAPDDAAPYIIKAQQLMQEGDADGAELWFWKALGRRPCYYTCYSLLAKIRLGRDKDDMLGKCFRHLELWKLALAPTIPDEAAARFGPFFEKTHGDAEDPGSYEDLAVAFERTVDPKALPADVRERMLPYRLLNDFEVQERDDIDADLLQEILANSARVIPVWRAALREWGSVHDALSPRACAVIAATLGEMAGPEVLDDLLELGTYRNVEICLHAQWAIWRLGQKYPAETLAHFRAATPSATCLERCNLADQTGLLPDTPGREDALADLLQGFAGFVDQPDAAYLLMSVTYALEESGQDERARELLAKNETALPKSGRKLLRELKEAEGGFVPFLIGHGIDELDIEDVCLDRLLMDEEEEEEEESSPPRFRPGRNDPCWCGSGKKYKKCHLAADEEAERRAAEPELEDADIEAPADMPLHVKVLGDLIGFSAERHRLRDLKEARRLYFGSSAGKVDENELAESGFFDWLVRDFRPRGKGPALVEEYLQSRGTGLPAAERELLQNWSAARYGLYEVQRVEEGAGVELKDVFGGEPFFVHDVSSSHELVRWDAILNRVEESEGRWVFSGNGVLVPRNLLSDVVSIVEKDSREAGQTPAEYLRTNSHRWYQEVKELSQRMMRDLKVVTTEGDAMEFCSATYSVRDEGAAAAALASAKVFEETTSTRDTPGVRRFGWLEAVREGPRRSYGHIEMAGGQLRLEANSRRRLEIGRQLLEKHAGSWLEHQRDSFESVASALEKRRSEEPAPPEPKDSIPPEIARELILKMKTEHYAKWPDEPLPALDGKTPREAVRSASGRKAVDDLLRMMENGEARARKEGDAAFDFTTVRRALGLETK